MSSSEMGREPGNEGAWELLGHYDVSGTTTAIKISIAPVAGVLPWFRYLASLRGHVAAVYQIAWSADSRLLVSGSSDSTLKVWDVKAQKLSMDLPGHADEVQRPMGKSYGVWGTLKFPSLQPSSQLFVPGSGICC